MDPPAVESLLGLVTILIFDCHWNRSFGALESSAL